MLKNWKKIIKIFFEWENIYMPRYLLGEKLFRRIFFKDCLWNSLTGGTDWQNMASGFNVLYFEECTLIIWDLIYGT